MPKEDQGQENLPDVQRRTVLQSTAVGAGLGMSGLATAQKSGEKLTDGPSGGKGVPPTTTTQIDEPPTVLLIRNCAAWSRGSTYANEIALQELGYDYEVISSQDAVDQLPGYDQLGEIDVILIPSTQERSYYQDINSIWETISGYVELGGILIVHAGELGWPCNAGDSGDDSLLTFPREVNNEYTFLEDPGEEVPVLQKLTVREETHPIAEGLDDEAISNWARDISTFGYYSGVPPEANEIFGLQVDPEAHPTYVEYPFGQGRVLTTMQAPEWPFEDGPGRDGTVELMYNELEYAVDTAGEILEPPERGRVRGTVTVASSGELLDDGQAYLVDPVLEGEVISYVNGEGPLPETEASRDIQAGEFTFDEIEPGERLVLVDPPNEYTPVYESVSVPIEQTTPVSFTVQETRYLSPLDPEINRLEIGAQNAIEASTKDAAEVYVDAANTFSDDLDLQDYLNGALSAMNFAFGLSTTNLPVSQEIASFVGEQTILPLAEHGLNEAVASRVNDVETDFLQDELETYTQQLLDTDWITSLQNTGSVSFARGALASTSMYQSSLNGMQSTIDEFETLATEQPASDFSMTETKQALQTQARWLEENGQAPGVVITPDGSGYVTREAAYHRGFYDSIKGELEAAELLETASLGVSTAGNAATVTGVGAIPGQAVAIAGWAGSMAFSMHQVYLQNQLALAWTDTLTYWISDLNDTNLLVADLVNWLETELSNPRLQTVDGIIEATDLGGVSPPGTDTTYALANKPDYPAWWVLSPLPTPQWKRRATNTVTIQNTGPEPTDFTLTNVDTYGGGETDGVSDAVSMYPHDFRDEYSGALLPGEVRDIEIEYTSDFHWYNPFNWHTMMTTLWMNGKVVDSVEDPYYIVPNMEVIPFSEQAGDSLDVEEALSAKSQDVPIKTRSYMLTDGSKAPGEPLTVDDWSEYVGDIEAVIDDTVSPDQSSVETQVSVPAESNGVVFVLGAAPDADLNLHATDEQGRHVGYDPEEDDDVVEIPNAEYNGHESTVQIISIDDASGEYTVEAEGVRFIGSDSVAASVYTVDVPERDPVLGVSPTVSGTHIKANQTRTRSIEISETSNQNDIEVTSMSLGSFENDDGTSLTDVDVSLSQQQLTVPAGETKQVTLEFDAASDLELPPGDSHRFDSELTVETENAGTSVIGLSVLLFETDDDIRITEAGTDVESVTVQRTDTGNVPEPPVDEMSPTDAFTVETAGEGIVGLSFPASLVDGEMITGFKVNDGDWESVSVSVGERATAEFAVPVDSMFVLAREEPDIAPLPEVGTAPPRDIDADGVHEDLDGNGQLTLDDVRLYYAEILQQRDSEYVQNNLDAFDVNGDGQITVADLHLLFTSFVESNPQTAADLGLDDVDLSKIDIRTFLEGL